MHIPNLTNILFIQAVFLIKALEIVLNELGLPACFGPIDEESTSAKKSFHQIHLIHNDISFQSLLGVLILAFTLTIMAGLINF